MTTVDRRGESEESGDDETRRRSINGDVDPNQPTDTGESSPAPRLEDKGLSSVSDSLISVPSVRRVTQ